MIPIESGHDAQDENKEKKDVSTEEPEAPSDVIDVQPAEEDVRPDSVPSEQEDIVSGDDLSLEDNAQRGDAAADESAPSGDAPAIADAAWPASAQPASMSPAGDEREGAQSDLDELSSMRTMAAHGEDDVRRAQEDVAAAKESFDDAVEAAEARDADLPTGPDAPLTDPQRMLDEVAAAEAQLNAAQARYEAAKAKAAASTPPQPPSAQAASSYPPPAQLRQPASYQPSSGPAPAAGYVPPAYAQTPHAGPGAVPPTQPTQQPTYTYQQPYEYSYTQPPYAQPYVTTKDHVAAGLLAIFLGQLGIHKFYLGYNTAGFIMLAVTILGSLLTFGLAAGVVWVIAIIEGVLYLTKSQTEFEQIYVFNKREWF